MEAATMPDTDEEEADGATIEDLADDPEANGPEEETLVGTSGQLSFSVGGKRPSTSTISIGSAAREVDGQYQKGDVIVLKVIARIDKIAFADKHDSSGNAIDCGRAHSAKPLSISVVGEADGE